jgi:hypothetical protein
MTEPAQFDPETTPTVTLAGREWPIPELVWRDLRKCRAELIEMNGKINEALAASAAEQPMAVVARVFKDLSNEDYDRLVMAPIHAGLAVAHPELARAEFEAWSVSEADRQMAWLVVRRQSGLFFFGDAGPSPGEAEGADQSPTQTGNGSSFRPAATSATPGNTGGRTSHGRSTSKSRNISLSSRRPTV